MSSSSVVRGTGGSVVKSSANANDPNGKSMQHWAISDEFIWSEGGKGGDTINEWYKPGLCEARSHAYHVLLRHAHVEEPVWEGVGEGFNHGETEIAGQQDDPLISRGEFSQYAYECAPHFAPRPDQ